ncbi:chromate resistance protein [Rhizobium sp. TH2]|uniref:sulfurtransferase/chromate resistance protein n=1 Tax=Rhizobium sp. TH2 TaxID=2775403 RepID=UPI0021576B2D|nr:sulfurtransferase/chromate resistance protein [Rhizobium sp. TH2]UVC07560.1 chromate resistance protein [Rhizobium sp. TH2]
MANFGSISADKLFKLIGTPQSPVIIDVRDDDDFAAIPSLIPSSIRLDYSTVDTWAGDFARRQVVVVCKRGKKLSEGVAAFLRLAGAAAEVLDGGTEAWIEAGLPMVPVARIPGGAVTGNTLWVTRSRPKIDRIACPWLIRRFVDPQARFLFVTASEVEAVTEKFGATPFDIEGVFWSHRGETCTFDTMIEEFALDIPALHRLAEVVRGADTDRHDLAPQAAGLLAVSLGLSRMHSSDLAQLEDGMLVYDAFYRWARDATEERHTWEAHAPRRAKP